MSAIAGVIQWEGGVTGETARAMLSTMPHRDRTGARTWSNGIASMGCIGLRDDACSIASSPAATVVLAGRLHFREDLRRALRSRPADDASDAAYVLAAFEQWGDACLEHIDGELACAIWDA